MPNISIDTKEIQFTDNFDFLGIIIDKHLNWKSHILKISHKVSKTVGVMNKLKHFLPSHTLLTIYNSLVMPHFIYGIQLWESQCKKLEKLQKRAIRVVMKASFNAHTEPIFKALKVLKLQDQCALHDLKFCYKYMNKLLPLYFESLFVRNCDNHLFHTRNSQNFQIPKIRHYFAKNTISYRMPETYNKCIPCIKEKMFTHSLPGFSHYIKNYLIENYSYQCNVVNCYICT